MMIEEIKLMLGDSASNYSDALISLCYKRALAEVEDYCGREADTVMELLAQDITILKLNRIGTEGISSQSYSGISEGYIDGYPQNIVNALNKKRRIRTFFA